MNFKLITIALFSVTSSAFAACPTPIQLDLAGAVFMNEDLRSEIQTVLKQGDYTVVSSSGLKISIGNGGLNGNDHPSAYAYLQLTKDGAEIYSDQKEVRMPNRALIDDQISDRKMGKVTRRAIGAMPSCGDLNL